MPTITFASSKGGAGRTTSAIILATTLARKYTVILIDADPDQRLMSWSTRAAQPSRLKALKSQGTKHILAEIGSAQKQAEFVIVDLDAAAIGLTAHAVGESDLVIIPMGDEQPDAQAAIETLAWLSLEAKALRRDILAKVLFARTEEKASKSRLAHSINAQMREKVEVLRMELHYREAYSSLHAFGGTLQGMDLEDVAGLAQAQANAELFAEEVIVALEGVEQKHVPSVQMSVRMKADVYDRFRALCEVERRTNGEMLEVLLGKFLPGDQGGVEQ
jgi:chromosome partitioning protein